MRLIFVVQMLDAKDANLGFIVHWARALAREVEELVVLSLTTRDVDIAENVRVVGLGKEKGASKSKQALRFAAALRQELFRNNCDAVLAHMAPTYAVACAPFTFLAGVPLFTWYTHRNVSVLLRIAEKVSRLCFTASQDSFRLSSPKKKVMGHGIDLELFSSKDELILGRNGPLRLVSASRLSPVKRVDVLLEALQGLSGDWTLDVAGDAPIERQKPYEDRVRRLADAMGQRVRFHGAIPYTEMPKLLANGDVLVNLSETGSLDKGVLEAVAVGCTVLTGNQAFRELLRGTEERTYLEEITSEGIRSRVEGLIGLPRRLLQEDRDVLYQRVREGHGLESLAKRLVVEMKRELGQNEPSA